MLSSSEIAGEYGSKPLYRNLGYFSSICLLRVHVLLGDPTRTSGPHLILGKNSANLIEPLAVALQTMQNIDLGQDSLATKITACYIATYYHVGFAYLVMGRYSDAIKIFISVLIYFNRMKQYHTRSYQYGSVSRM